MHHFCGNAGETKRPVAPVAGRNGSAKSIYATRVLKGSTFATLVLSVPLMVMGFWLAIAKHQATCYRFIEFPIIIIGIALCVASMVGLVGAQRRERHMVWVYMVAVFGLILFLCAMVFFTVFVTRGGAAYAVSKAAFHEYRLGSYSLWFQAQVRGSSEWGEMVNCLQNEAHVCTGLDGAYPSRASFFKAHLSPPQSGCCKPPIACGYTFVHATEWVNTTRGLATSDCGRWDSNPRILCYQCSSCRAGLLQNVKQAWEFVATLSLAILVCLIIIYCIGWLGFMTGLWYDAFVKQQQTSNP